MTASFAYRLGAVTVTVNPAIDHTIWVPGFRAGAVNRVAGEQFTPGGKGVNVAAFMRAFGIPVLATGLLGTRNAAVFETFFEAQRILHRFVPVPGTTRTGIKIVDDQAGMTTDVDFPGLEVRGAHLAALEDTLAQLVTPGLWVVLAGSLPPRAPATTYRRLVEIAHRHGGHVALDTSGPALAGALSARPEVIKPNRAELEELTGHSLGDRRALVGAARELARRGVATVAVSLGADGALFVSEPRVVFARAPKVQVASTVGAGDAMVAGIVAGALEGLALRDRAALATSFAGAALSQIGPRLDPAAVRQGAGRVELEEV